MEKTKTDSRLWGGLEGEELEFCFEVERAIAARFGGRMFAFTIALSKGPEIARMKREGHDAEYVAFKLVTGRKPH